MVKKILYTFIIALSFLISNFVYAGTTIGPVNSFVDLNFVTNGVNISTSTLNSGTLGSQGWYELFDNNTSVSSLSGLKFQASKNNLLSPINVNGTVYPVSHISHSIALDHNYFYQTAVINAGGTSAVSTAGWITFGPPDMGIYGQTFDYAFIFGSGGSFAGLQLKSGQGYYLEIETGGPVTHSSPIYITPGSTYWFSLKADWINGISSLYIYDTEGNSVGMATTTMPIGETGTSFAIGNNETGTSSSVSYFEDIVIDYTNALSPILPNASSTSAVNLLVVAGGGGGGQFAGGGGAGEYYSNSSYILSPQTYNITVGAGGAGSNSGPESGVPGTNGSNSIFANVTMIGGGGGGTRFFQTGNVPANDGGSGGGAPSSYSGQDGAGGISLARLGLGNAGGTNTGHGDGGAGGGGAGSIGIGSTGTVFGHNGGSGMANSISGSTLYYAGGGGGGAYGGNAIGLGGSGVGGDGNSTTYGGNGVANTGSGGGGGSYNFGGGNGADGVIVISFPTNTLSVTSTGGFTKTISGGNDIYTFTSNGTFTFFGVASSTPVVRNLLMSMNF